METLQSSPRGRALVAVDECAAEVTKWLARRDVAIIEAHEAGWSLRELARVARLSHGTIHGIIRRAGVQ